jgi:hypothetical protein
MDTNAIRARLEQLRTEIRAERISYGEIAELQTLAEHIDPSDVELLEWAGVPEHAAEPRFCVIDNPDRDDPSLPEPASCRNGAGPYLLPIVDEKYGGVIAWANTPEQAERIVRALNTID